MYQSPSFRRAQAAYDNMMPEEPEEAPVTECEECGDEFEFDADQYMDADEDGARCYPPSKCEGCESGLTPYLGITVYVYEESEAKVIGPCTVYAAYAEDDLLGVRHGDDEFEVFTSDLVHGPRQLPASNL